MGSVLFVEFMAHQIYTYIHIYICSYNIYIHIGPRRYAKSNQPDSEREPFKPCKQALNLSLPRLSLQRGNLWGQRSGHSPSAEPFGGVLSTRLALRRLWAMVLAVSRCWMWCACRNLCSFARIQFRIGVVKEWCAIWFASKANSEVSNHVGSWQRCGDIPSRSSKPAEHKRCWE